MIPLKFETVVVNSNILKIFIHLFSCLSLLNIKWLSLYRVLPKIHITHDILYSKNLAGETLANLAICYEFAKVLSAKYLSYLKKLGAGLEFTKVFFAKCNLASYSPKLSPAKIFRYTVVYSKHKNMII